MLEIKPSLDNRLIAAYCKKCGKLPGPEFYLYQATNRGEQLAAALFEVTSDRVSVLWYQAEDEGDFYLLDAVLRAGLNYAAEHGISTGCLPEEFRQAHSASFAKMNYPAQSVFDITNFFAKYKNCNSQM